MGSVEMKFISWNVNGLRACMNKGFKEFMDSVDADVFCVQETKMQREQAEFVFPGYEEYWNSAEKRGIPVRLFFLKSSLLLSPMVWELKNMIKKGVLLLPNIRSFIW